MRKRTQNALCSSWWERDQAGHTGQSYPKTRLLTLFVTCCNTSIKLEHHSDFVYFLSMFSLPQNNLSLNAYSPSCSYSKIHRISRSDLQWMKKRRVPYFAFTLVLTILITTTTNPHSNDSNSTNRTRHVLKNHVLGAKAVWESLLAWSVKFLYCQLKFFFHTCTRCKQCRTPMARQLL